MHDEASTVDPRILHLARPALMLRGINYCVQYPTGRQLERNEVDTPE